jgi:hypothetical protein
MMRVTRFVYLSAGLTCLVVAAATAAQAATLTVDLGNSQGVKSVGVFDRWDADGNANKKVNQNAKIDAPEVDFAATQSGSSRWVFSNIKPGTYDIVILAANKTRIEGFTYPPAHDFDPFFPGTATCEDQEARDFILDSISKDTQYENKVSAFYLGGDKKTIRVLVQLLRDLATSYTKGAGTMRHEIWQYNWNYGGWRKDKRTRVLDRIIMQVSELKQWHWLWEPKLGGIEVKHKDVTVHYEVPKDPDPEKLKGLYPY